MAKVSGYDRRNRARTMSWMSMGEDAGTTLGPMLAAFLWSTWGIGVLMGVRVLIALATEAYAMLVAPVPEDDKAVAARRNSETDRLLCSSVPDLPSDEAGEGL